MKKKYYYDEDNFKLILGDSLKELKKIEPKSIDMIFADPPINIIIFLFFKSLFIFKISDNHFFNFTSFFTI